MKLRIRWSRLLAIAVLFPSIITGCGASSSGQIKTSTPLRASTTSTRTIVIYVTSQVPDSQETTRELEGAVVEKLREAEAFARVFSSVSVGTRVPDLSVKATITKFAGVSAAARESLSPLLVGPIISSIGDAALQATIEADVVVHSKTGEIVGSATVRGDSSKVTIQAIQRTAEQIAGFVAKQ